MTVTTIEDLRAVRKKAADCFRLEALPQYLVPQEDAGFTAWKQGIRIARTPDTSSWLENIRDTTATGVRWWRVRILDYPLAEYSKYELYSYQANAAAGEDIYVANRAWHSDLADMRDDFWIYDHATVFRMIYDEEGRFLHPEQVEDARPYLNTRDTAYRHAIPLVDYLHRYEPSLIA